MINKKKSLQALLAISVVSALGGCSALSGNAEPVQVTDRAVVDQSQYSQASLERRIERHFYAGLGIGASRLNPDTSDMLGVEVSKRQDTGGQLTLGMDIDKRFSVEVHGSKLGTAGLSPSGGVEYNMLGASALLYAGKHRHMYRRQGLTGYGRLGLGLLRNSGIDNTEVEQVNPTNILIGCLSHR